MAWTTTQLLAHIRRVASASTATTAEGYTDADLLVHADAALMATLGPLVANARDEHGIHAVDVAVAAGQTTVRLPPRVAAGRLRDITQLAANGVDYVGVPRLEPEDVAMPGFGTPRGPGILSVVVQAGFLRLVPTPTTAVTLRLSFLRAPPALATLGTATLLTGLTAGTPNITATHAGTLATGRWDFILKGNGDSLGDSVQTVVAALGSTTFAASGMYPAFQNASAECARYVSEGVYLCPEGTTVVVPLPDAWSPIVAQKAAIAFMTAIGDSEAAGRASEQLERMESQALTLVSERVEGEPQVVRPTFQNRGGFRAGWR